MVCCYLRVTLGLVRIRQFVAGIVVTICVGVPLVEAFDRWDHTLQDGNDTEANVVIATLCFGLAFSVAARIIVGRPRALPMNYRVQVNGTSSACAAPAPLASPVPTVSPPIPLRI